MIGYRLYDPDNDGKTKLDNVSEMLEIARTRLLPQGRPLPFHTVLMDSWYATKNLMLQIDGWKKENAEASASAGQKFYCPLRLRRFAHQLRAFRFVPAWRQNALSPATRHLEGATYAFADGHVKWLKPESVSAQSPSASNFTFALR